MDDEWDKDNFDPEPKIPAVVDRWEGEDEDDDVKESWEDEEDEDKEEKKDVEKQDDDVTTKAVQVKKSKKSLSEKIEEKERLAKAELEQKLKAKKNLVLDEDEEEEEKEKELTPEEKLALKVQQQKLLEEADLRLAMETFGVEDKEASGTGLDGTPSTLEEFNDYQTLLIAKMDNLSKSAHFPIFAEEIVRNICLQLPLVSLKKVKSSVEVISQEKLKLEKGDKKKKGKGKAQLRLEGSVNLLNEYSAYKDLEDYDDFM